MKGILKELGCVILGVMTLTGFITWIVWLECFIEIVVK